MEDEHEKRRRLQFADLTRKAIQDAKANFEEAVTAYKRVGGGLFEDRRLACDPDGKMKREAEAMEMVLNSHLRHPSVLDNPDRETAALEAIMKALYPEIEIRFESDDPE